VVFNVDCLRLQGRRMAGKRNAKRTICWNSMTPRERAENAQDDTMTQEKMQTGVRDMREKTTRGIQQSPVTMKVGKNSAVTAQGSSRSADDHWRAADEMDKVLDRLEGRLIE
jgi:hypothetical protein